MAQKRKKKKKQQDTMLNGSLHALWLIAKLPWYAIKGITYLFKKGEEQTKKVVKQRKRKQMTTKYEAFKVIETKTGSYNEWEETLLTKDSQIGIILGARGSGKTAIGIKLLENFHEKTNKKIYTMGFDEKELPVWMKNIDDITKIQNNAVILIDEGGILYSSRKSMSNANNILSNLILIARHKNINILFITQNSANLEINTLRQADYLLLKPSSLLQKELERNIIKKLYEKTTEDFKTHKKHKGITYIHADTYEGFINNPLPTFWKETISKSYK